MRTRCCRHARRPKRRANIQQINFVCPDLNIQQVNLKNIYLSNSFARSFTKPLKREIRWMFFEDSIDTCLDDRGDGQPTQHLRPARNQDDFTSDKWPTMSLTNRLLCLCFVSLPEERHHAHQSLRDPQQSEKVLAGTSAVAGGSRKNRLRQAGAYPRGVLEGQRRGRFGSDL
jgi:hypothetical protein